MSISDEILRLQTAKSDLATAITNKGVTVPANATLDDYATLVDSIQTGGGGSTLPYDAKVEYIGVRQGAYIQTGNFIPTGLGISINMVAKFISYPTSTSYAQWFVARTDASHRSYRVVRGSSSSKLNVNNANNDSNSYSASFTPSANTVYHIILNSKTFFIENATAANASGSTFTLSTTRTGDDNENYFVIGDMTPDRGTNLNIYSFTVRNYGNVMMDLIPVRVGQVGYMYDRISGSLFGKGANSTNELVVGDDV